MKSHQRFSTIFAVWVIAGLVLVPAGCLAQAQTAGQHVAAGNSLPKRIVADYGYWSRNQNPPYSSAQIPFSKLTQVNHAGVSLGSNALGNADGTLSVPHGFLEPKLLTRAHAAGVKVLLLLGGDPAFFSTVAANPVLRAILVSNLWTFITTNNYDGVDIDWEFPSSSTDRTAFAALVEDLRVFLPQPHYLITLDVGPWGGTDTPFHKLEPLVDQFNIMMYDCAGPWTADAQLNSPIFWDPNDPHPEECQPGGSVADAADIYLNSLQIPASKLNMGTPFYGYLYKTVGVLFGNCPGADSEQNIDCPDNTVLSVNYGTFIKQRVNNQGWVRYYDSAALVPYLLRANGKPGFITYDDSLSTYLRVWYSVWSRGLGGSFMWSADADYDGHSQDLLDAMYWATLRANCCP